MDDPADTTPVVEDPCKDDNWMPVPCKVEFEFHDYTLAKEVVEATSKAVRNMDRDQNKKLDKD